MFDISNEFLEENKNNLCQFRPKQKRTGPYSKSDKQKRRDEVYRLHFKYGYSARSISEMMKTHRNTINADINYWYGKIVDSNKIFEPETWILITLERMTMQRTRLTEMLSATKSNQEKLQIEKTVNDIDYRITMIQLKLAEASRRIFDLVYSRLNKILSEEKIDKRLMTVFDCISVSQKSREHIKRIIHEDRRRR